MFGCISSRTSETFVIDRLNVGHVAKLFQAIEDENEWIEANNTDRKVLELQIKQTRVRKEKRVFREQLASLPSYRRVAGPSTRNRRATLRAALNDAIARQLITLLRGRGERPED